MMELGVVEVLWVVLSAFALGLAVWMGATDRIDGQSRFRLALIIVLVPVIGALAALGSIASTLRAKPRGTQLVR